MLSRLGYLLPVLLSFVAVGCEQEKAESSGGGQGTSAKKGLLAVGAKAPEINSKAHDGTLIRLESFRGKAVIVYFYPKDDTPGCTAEAKGFRDQFQALSEAGAVVLGVSTDDKASHKAFAEKYSLPFLLLPDEDKKIAKAFGVPLRLGYAKRVTFVIDRAGKIAKVYDDVSPERHAQELLAVVRKLGS